MKTHLLETPTNARFHLFVKETRFEETFLTRRQENLLTIAWNTGPAQSVVLNEVRFIFPAQSILPLMGNQSFRFERPADVTVWQFNREFYCIVDHDKEVSCVGFLFYGTSETMFITLDEQEQKKFRWLLFIFLDELRTRDTLQVEMLRLLLKRLIVKLTRLAKQQYVNGRDARDQRMELMSRYHLLVESHYRRHHQVQFYARQLNKSTKTLSKLFARYQYSSPRQILYSRLLLEAKRLFHYSDKSTKEVAYELGFDEPAHFSRFFKKQTGLTPSAFRKTRVEALRANI